ncbi:site-specific integrase [Spartinivicinus ruber]|uniref:site-specific integrase n=1 Tax=Spartinivicinus ruber TaxID=2683272 RepID=UPI002E317DF3|nr:site-specific integrase [Spartinivicinus ruber]
MDYLRTRNGTFYFRKVIPMELRYLFCKGELQLSLGTKTKTEARTRAATLRGAINAAIDEIKSEKKLERKLAILEQLDIFLKSFINKKHKAYESLGTRQFKPRQGELNQEKTKPKITTLSVLYIQFETEKVATEWGHKAKEDYYTAFKALIDLVGDVVPAKVNNALANKYSQGLLTYPQRRAVGPNAKLSLKELAKRNSPTISARTAKNHFTRMNVFFNWLAQRKYIKANPLSGLSPKGKKTTTKKLSFNQDDLKLIFSQPLFKEKKYNCEWQYWLPILALYTGARLEELAQLSASDVKQEEGIYYLHIHGEENNQLKNENSARKIPLHCEVLSLGFLDYLATRQGQQLFQLNKVSGKYGKNVTKWFTRFKQRLGFGPSKVFHSFRHTFRDLAVESGVPSEHIKALLGHTQGDVTHGIYGSGFSLRVLNASLQKIEVRNFCMNL